MGKASVEEGEPCSHKCGYSKKKQGKLVKKKKRKKAEEDRKGPSDHLSRGKKPGKRGRINHGKNGRERGKSKEMGGSG